MNRMVDHVSIKQIQELDRIAIEEYAVPSIALMENAGKSIADDIVNILNADTSLKITVVCGIGNNAGDGFVVARHLINADFPVDIILIGEAESLKKDALINCRILKKCGYSIVETKMVIDEVRCMLQESSLVVDAIFGVGLNRAVESPYKEFIRAINNSRKKVVSIDIPSGLNGDTGEVWGECVYAYKTITFSFKKKGFDLNNAGKYVGDVKVVDIGIPKNLYKKIDASYS